MAIAGVRGPKERYRDFKAQPRKQKIKKVATGAGAVYLFRLKNLGQSGKQHRKAEDAMWNAKKSAMKRDWGRAKQMAKSPRATTSKAAKSAARFVKGRPRAAKTAVKQVKMGWSRSGPGTARTAYATRGAKAGQSARRATNTVRGAAKATARRASKVGRGAAGFGKKAGASARGFGKKAGGFGKRAGASAKGGATKGAAFTKAQGKRGGAFAKKGGGAAVKFAKANPKKVGGAAIGIAGAAAAGAAYKRRRAKKKAAASRGRRR